MSWYNDAYLPDPWDAHKYQCLDLSTHSRSQSQPCHPEPGLDAGEAEIVTDQAPASTAEGEVILFCDGSFIEQAYGGAGVAYKKQDGVWSGRAVPLRRIKNSGDAEAAAILFALMLARELFDDSHHSIITVYNHCQPAIDLIMTEITRASNAFIRAARAECWRLRTHGTGVKLVWVKGHHICLGNELADMLASIGSKASAYGSAPFVWAYEHLDAQGAVPVPDEVMQSLVASAEHQKSERRERLQEMEQRGEIRAEVKTEPVLESSWDVPEEWKRWVVPA
ncbi:hypothetical protein LTR37_002328 [Vermiconidia calcicola]|uniref:Uncharacterized protein n=1 Tax=Vermiconidia calcicola TaxID=1690605 RepID=A0ACC3NTM1_9PEZI|nr:hypothetical protein LTR37_002328 [Vermiconidia calcicola]